MNNKRFPVILLVVILSVLVLAYGGFWMFKAREHKRQINNFVMNFNSQATTPQPNTESTPDSQISIGNVEVIGFPLAHKTIIKDFKIGDAKSGYSVIKNIEIESGVFSPDFAINTIEPITILDKDNNVQVVVEFNPDSKINGSTQGDKISHLKYSGSGYKTLDKNKNLTYIFEHKNLQILFANEGGIQFKISDDGNRILDGKGNVLFTSESTLADITATKDDKKGSLKINAQIKNFEYFKSEISTTVAPIETTPSTVVPTETTPTTKIPNIKAPLNKGKNNLLVNVSVNYSKNEEGKEIDLLPPEQMAALPADIRVKFKSKPAAYIWDVDIQNLDFSNLIYKILINGKFATLPDDKIPSGKMVIKIDNLDGLLEDIFGNIQRFTEKVMEDPSSDSAEENNAEMAASMVVVMMTQFVDRLNPVLKEVAAQNPESKDNLLVFEIKRERKAPTLINGISPMDILSRLEPPAPPAQEAPVQVEETVVKDDVKTKSAKPTKRK